MTQVRGHIGETLGGYAPTVGLSPEQIAANNAVARAHYAEIHPDFFKDQGVQLELPATEVPQL